MNTNILKKVKPFLVVAAASLAGLAGAKIGFSKSQIIAISVFCVSVMGVLFFWESRLSFVFLGAGILLITRAVNLENFLKFASLDVIFFLIGMMILVGMLNDAGLFFWLITKLLTVTNLTGVKLFILLMSVSAGLSGLIGEVASIIILTKVILELCDFFEIDPVPLLISSVFATNIGSAGTVLGNPIGILIAARGNLSFEDFLFYAFPITLFILAATIIVLCFWFRKYLRQLNTKVAAIKENRFFLSLISIPADKKLIVNVGIFLLTLLAISLHRRLELLFHIEENTLLLMIPLFSAGVALLYRSDKMRHYIEQEVEWTSVLFFLFLFAQAGVIKYSGIADFFAQKLMQGISGSSEFLSAMMLFSSGILSSILDNTVVVASYVPIAQSLGSLGVNIEPIWWAILFGACYGGNITVIGSTANIVAMDIFEKKKKMKIRFLTWLKVGLVIGVFNMLLAYAFIRLSSL